MADPNRIINQGTNFLFSNIHTLRNHLVNRPNANPNELIMLQTRLTELNTQCFRVDVRNTIRKIPLPAELPFDLRDQDFIALYCDNLDDINWIPLIQAFMKIEHEPAENKYMIYNVCKNHESLMRMNTLLNFVVSTLNNNYNYPRIELDVYLYNMFFNQAFNLYAMNGFEAYDITNDLINMRYVRGSTRTLEESMKYKMEILDRVRRRIRDLMEITDDDTMRIDRVKDLLNIETAYPAEKEIYNKWISHTDIDDGMIPIYGIMCHGQTKLIQNIDRTDLNRGNVRIPNGMNIRFRLFNKLGNTLPGNRVLTDTLYIPNSDLCQLNPPGEGYINIFPDADLQPDSNLMFQARVVCRTCNYNIIHNITGVTTLSDILDIIDQHHTRYHSNNGRNIQVNCFFCTSPGHLEGDTSDKSQVALYLSWYLKNKLLIDYPHHNIRDPIIQSILLNFDAFIIKRRTEIKNELNTYMVDTNFLILLDNYIIILITRIDELINDMFRKPDGSVYEEDNNTVSMRSKLEYIHIYIRNRLTGNFQGKNISKKVKKRYLISSYTKQKARKMGVDVRPSTRKGKKIDVYKNGRKVASVGALGYNDFTTYSKKNKSRAKERRRLYHIRHKRDSSKRGSPGYYASKLLW